MFVFDYAVDVRTDRRKPDKKGAAVGAVALRVRASERVRGRSSSPGFIFELIFTLFLICVSGDIIFAFEHLKPQTSITIKTQFLL